MSRIDERDERRLLSAVIADMPPLAKHGEAGNGRGKNRGDVVTSTRGNRTAYLAARAACLVSEVR
jgi:hypothetical protein